MTQLGDGSLLKADGPAIEYLSLRPDDSNRTRWNRSTHWIELDRSLALTYLATKLMESVWAIARYRYLLEKPDHLDAWVKPSYADVMKRIDDEGEIVVVEAMHVELDYYASPQESDRRQDMRRHEGRPRI